MSTHNGDDHVEAVLRGALSTQAELTHPTGDGLSRIQERVAARQARLRWMRPALALGLAVLVVGAGVGAYAVVHGSGGSDAVIPAGPSHSPSQSPNSVPATGDFPQLAFFPFTTAADETTWEQGYTSGGHMPWVADPTAVASFWVQNYLKQPSVTKVLDKTVDGSTADVTLGRKVNDGGSGIVHAVTVVHLAQFHKAWLVTGASDGTSMLSIDSPAADTAISSPVAVSGPGFGVDEAADVQVRDATTPDLFGHASTGSFGNNPNGWSASVQFASGSSTTGVLVVVEDSQADGGPARITAEKVQFAAATGTVAPAYFYGVKGGRVAKFSSRNGASLSYLTDAQPGGGVVSVQHVGDSVYFLAGTGSCSTDIESVPTSGGSSSVVASGDSGYAITSFAMSQQADKVAFSETSCTNNGKGRLAFLNGKARLVFVDLASHTSRSIAFASAPPVIEGGPAWEPDGVHVDAFVRTGTMGYLARYNATSDTTPTPSANACSGYDVNSGLPQAIDVAAGGALWFATQTGSSMQVVRCESGQPSAVFTVPGADTPSALAVTPDGSAALLTDIHGKVWVWDGSNVVELSPSQPLTSVTW